jgi:cytochrome c peroxidase
MAVGFLFPALASTQELPPIEQLGKELFFDKISEPSRMSCSSCHSEAIGWTGRIAGINAHGSVFRGARPQRFGSRKPPTVAYATFSPMFHFDSVRGQFVGGNFWDGRATGEILGQPSADQALGPFLNQVEQNMSDMEAVIDQVARSRYAGLFRQVWGPGSLDYNPDIPATVESVYGRIGLSIAAFEASTEVNQFSSQFDAYWTSSLAAGNDPEDIGLGHGDKQVLDPQNILNEQEFEGLIEFGKFCSLCHVSHRPGAGGVPPLLTSFGYSNIGVPKNPDNPFYDMDQVYFDDGTPINPLGDAYIDFGLGDFLRTRAPWEAMAWDNDGKFKIPTLRNVDKRMGNGTPKAYMHNGVFKSLKEVVHFYNTRDIPEEGWDPPEVDRNVSRVVLAGVPMGNFELSEEQEDAIVAFVKTLSDGYQDRRNRR